MCVEVVFGELAERPWDSFSFALFFSHATDPPLPVLPGQMVCIITDLQRLAYEKAQFKNTPSTS